MVRVEQEVDIPQVYFRGQIPFFLQSHLQVVAGGRLGLLTAAQAVPVVVVMADMLHREGLELQIKATLEVMQQVVAAQLELFMVPVAVVALVR